MIDSKRGYIAVPRGFFDDERFKSEPMSEREAFLWLAKEAAWEARTVRRGATSIGLKRGELVHSTRFMAKAWHWSEARVRRFLARLKNGALIDARPSRDATHITIRDYEQFSLGRRANETESDAPNDAQATRTKPLNHYTNHEASRRGEAEEAPTPAGTIFRSGVKYLTDSGTPEKHARSLLGMWRKKYGDDGVIAVLSDAQREDPSNPVPWIIAALDKRRQPGRANAPSAYELAYSALDQWEKGTIQ